MKFSQQLSAHITPEWQAHYIHYEELRDMLYKAAEVSPSAEMVEEEVVVAYVAKFDETFFNLCGNELTKINTFFSEKLAEATRKFSMLQSDLLDYSEYGQKHLKVKLWLAPKKYANTEGLKLAFSEFYLSLILLQNYQSLNYTGFNKILKKHDKIFGNNKGHLWMKHKVNGAVFNTCKEINQFIQETESIFTQEFEGGNRQKALKKLRLPPLGVKKNPWTTFKVGLITGAFIVLLCNILIIGIFTETNVDNWTVAIKLYRGQFLGIVYLYLLGINVYSWRACGINHVLIFELEPRDHISDQHFLEISSLMGLMWCFSLLCFLCSDYIPGIPRYAHPLVLFISFFVLIFNPIKIFHYQARKWFLLSLVRVFLSPVFFVEFGDFWIADQLNSLVTLLLDTEHLLQFYMCPGGLDTSHDKVKCLESRSHRDVLRAIVACLPAWFRFAQCLRRYKDMRYYIHLLNAFKYFTTFVVTTLSSLYIYSLQKGKGEYNVYFMVWLVSLAFSSLFSYAWDVKQDWGLLDSNAGENVLLRDELVYSKSVYYFAIFEDLFLRFGWVLTISLTDRALKEGELISIIVSPLELFRRFMWNLIRLENEHINNVGQFRAVRDISIAPIHDTDQGELIKMMDADETYFALKRKIRILERVAEAGDTSPVGSSFSNHG